MTDPYKGTNRAIDNEDEVEQRGDDPNATYPAGTDPVEPNLEEENPNDNA